MKGAASHDRQVLPIVAGGPASIAPALEIPDLKVQFSGTVSLFELEVSTVCGAPASSLESIRLGSVRRQDRLTRRFERLTREWKEAVAYVSSVTEMATHPAYQQIIGLGQAALPLILRELEKEPEHWFWALKAITGEDPVPAKDIGRVRAMAHAWLAWARGQGLEW